MPKYNIKSITPMDATPLTTRKPKKNRSLSLIVTQNCNLCCAYCYEKHDLRDTVTMDAGVAKEAIARCMEADDDFDGVIIDFFGGEPMLAFSLIRDIVDWFHTKKWNKEHRFMIGTNGTILDAEKKKWLLDNKGCVNVALSFDGTRTAHNLTRDNSYDIVRKNLPFFTENWPHQPSKMTICADTIPYVADSVIELEEMGLFFTANIGFEDMWGDETNKKKLLRIYQEQLSRLVDYYSERPHLYPVSPLLTAVPDYLGLSDQGDAMRKKQDIKRFCGAGHEMVVVDIDGKTYPCHRFLPWVTGKAAPSVPANCQEAWRPEGCAECKLILSCPTCAGFNWEVNKDTGIRSTYHCEVFKSEVMASARLEAIRLGQKMKDLDSMPDDEKRRLKLRLEAVWQLAENEI